MNGTDVVSAEGDVAGTVEHVLADEEADVFDGIVVRVRRPGRDRLCFVDAPDVGAMRLSAGFAAGTELSDVRKVRLSIDTRDGQW